MKVTNWKRKLFASLAAGGLLSPSAVMAADLNTNLVINGGFENVDTGTTGAYGSVNILDWGGTTPGFAYSHDGSAGAPDYANGGPLIGGGSYYFTPGSGGNQSLANALTQDIDVSAGDSGALIATGTAVYSLAADFSSYTTQADRGVVDLDFLDSGGGTLGIGTIGPSGNLSTWTHLSTAGLLPIGTETVRVSAWGVLAAGGSSDGYMDNIDFQVTDGVILSALDLTIDRETGSILLHNQTGSPVHISGYSITSSFGALAPYNWLSIAENYDANSGPPFVDPTNDWSELTKPADRGDLSEADLDTATGTTLAAGASIDLGSGAWIQNVNEGDLLFEYVSNLQAVSGLLFYEGAGGPLQLGDLNFDGELDALDWGIFRDGQQAVMTGLSQAEAYQMGDLTGDLANNHPDFVTFKTAYNAANGDGAFEAMVASVPEPSSLVLLAGVGLAMLVATMGRRDT